MKRSFKTEVFLTIPLSLLVFVLTCASLITQDWVNGEAKLSNGTDGIITYNFGLFKGEKVKQTFGSINFKLRGKFQRRKNTKNIHCF